MQVRRGTDGSILVVEDNALNMRLLNDVLEAVGYDVLRAAYAAEALRLARHDRPGLILMDLQLPDFSGLDATRMLRADHDTRDIPIVAVTAFAMPGEERRVLSAGCSAYLAKPVGMRQLLATVRRFLPQSPLQRADSRSQLWAT